ncbi:serine protease Do/serine protease DegQ [Lachnotalea glycerini]|uniref:PDZ domain-containing protein n=1 Tax=Lachnotalea glycerini TaxID=1763509 RepID=A0A318EPM6_9FIRM|nr:trypsin-like peptidase domain-containing protein [Lachnotalea glycerini]PXV91138.1 serine protease Do/serine protease DegQ [Lachnotalea glycerini]RDY28620.1 PDZ domain-containing protein [Lachnotalea glycerini]
MSGLNNEEEFSFIKEKIKEKPLNKKRLALKALLCIGMAVVFGSIASLSFVLTKPYFEEKLTKKEEPDKVSIPQDETSSDNADSAVSANTDATAQNSAQTENTPVVIPDFELELDDVEDLYKKFNEVAKEADQSVVTVTGVSSDVDWFNDTLENKGQAAGLIIANNGQELLMLTNLDVVENTEKILVTFCDGCTIEASSGKYDGNTRLAVVGVPLENIEESTMNSISVATLGNSYASHTGEIVLALGSPLGYSNSVTYGMLTSTSKSVTTVDANYRILTTDAVGSSNSSGVIINLKGEIIGIIAPEYTPDTSMGVVTALAISDLKASIEKLSNSEDVVYLGIKGSDVSTEIAKQQNIPVGVYVIEAVMDSPAMSAGIQNGDVITKIGDADIKTVRDMQNELAKYQVNQAITVVVKRQGMDEYKDINFTVTLGAMN